MLEYEVRKKERQHSGGRRPASCTLGQTPTPLRQMLREMKKASQEVKPSKYLPSVLPDRTVFRYRPFKDYGEVKQDFENAEIAFLLPSQLELLPDDSADLSINISSLHEMKPEQIRYYLKEISRLTKLYFYMKEWKVSKIPFENVIVKEEDYAIPEGWQQLYWRTCKVQTLFFEALFKTIKNQAKE